MSQIISPHESPLFAHTHISFTETCLEEQLLVAELRGGKVTGGHERADGHGRLPGSRHGEHVEEGSAFGERGEVREPRGEVFVARNVHLETGGRDEVEAEGEDGGRGRVADWVGKVGQADLV